MKSEIREEYIFSAVTSGEKQNVIFYQFDLLLMISSHRDYKNNMFV